MGMLNAAMNEINRGEIKWEEPLIAFKEINGTDFERAQAFHIINTIAKGSKIGKTVLEKAAENGYTIHMDYISGAAAACCSQNKRIILNPAFSEDMLISSMVHEARHAEQDMNATWTGERGAFTIETELMLARAKEADAQAIAAAACFEIRANTGNAGPLAEMYQCDSHIVGPLNNAAADRNSPVTTKMLQEAFKGWYNNESITETYERCYQVAQMNYASEKGDYSKTPFDKPLSSAQIVTDLCKAADGSCYFENDKDILADRDRCAISAETLKAFDKFFILREQRTGMPADGTYEALKVRNGSRGFKNSVDDLKRAFSSDYRKTFSRDKSEEIGLKKEGSSLDIRRINHLVNDLCADPENRKKLTALKSAGYTVAFENAMRLGTVRDDYKKMVLLNPALKDEALKGALLMQGEKIETRISVQTRMAAAQLKGRA
ncbi:MAG: hypothetical protein IJ752_04310 [Alphaproteobacteria bacterium]|nr:hypothetical protein [Alphaproteobacteria bacterium]